jgi:hypothetical protein
VSKGGHIVPYPARFSPQRGIPELFRHASDFALANQSGQHVGERAVFRRISSQLPDRHDSRQGNGSSDWEEARRKLQMVPRGQSVFGSTALTGAVPPHGAAQSVG